MRIAICPGSFDPVTKGHVDIIERTAKLFDRVVALVVINPAKRPFFTVEERTGFLRRATAHIGNVLPTVWWLLPSPFPSLAE